MLPRIYEMTLRTPVITLEAEDEQQARALFLERLPDEYEGYPAAEDVIINRSWNCIYDHDHDHGHGASCEWHD